MTVFPALQQAATPILESALDALEQALEKSLHLALKYHQSGQIENAESLYREILEIQPEHPEANYQLGRLAVQVNQAENGLPYFAVALEARPEQEHYWLAYIDALMQADEIETAQHLLVLGLQHGLQGEAVEALAERLEERTRAVQPFHYKQQTTVAQPPAVASSDKQQVKTKPGPSRSPLRKALPAPREIEKLVGRYKQRRFTEAEALARSLTLRFPWHGFGWKMLGVLIQVQRGPQDALLPMQTATEVWPDDAEAHVNLGIVLKALGRLTEAEASFQRVLEIAPTNAEAHNNLGIICKGRGRLIDAEDHYRRALKTKPVFVEAHSNLGNVLKALGRMAEAEASYRRALEIAPEFPEVHSNLGTVLDEQGRAMEAEASFRRALQAAPDDAVLHSNLLFRLSLSETESTASLFAEHCRFGEKFEAPLRALWREHSNSRDPERCLQIGFVSGDFYNHAMASFIEPVLEHMVGHERLSLHAYSNNLTEDEVSLRLRGLVRYWHEVAHLSDAALAEKVRADGIDILIDLSGHTDKHRLLSLARKPAPVQVSWMGYPGTTGLSGMDYYLTDRFLLPPGQFDQQFTEKLAYLPANAPFLPSVDAPPVNELPALRNGYVTFGSFNRPNKISRAVIAMWAQLLHALPTSRMVLGAMPQDGQYDTLIGWFADEGIARQRLSFHSRTGMPGYLALHHQVDVCLDTFPYNGGTTTLHALWMGVPTLTLAGSTVAGRTGAGILGHVGLDKFVVRDASALVEEGLVWANRLPELAILRAELRERFAQSAIGQPALIAAGLTRTLRTMWQRWCADLPTESLDANGASVQNMHGAMQEEKA